MFAFTEQGVAMLSTVLKSANATSVSVAIMRFCDDAAFPYR